MYSHNGLNTELFFQHERMFLYYFDQCIVLMVSYLSLYHLSFELKESTFKRNLFFSWNYIIFQVRKDDVNTTHRYNH